MIQFIKDNSAVVFNAFTFLATRVMSLVFYALSIPLFIKHFSADKYGEVVLMFAILGISAFLESGFNFLINQIIGRYFARTQKKKEQLFTDIVFSFLLVAVVCSFFGLVYVEFFSQTEFKLFYIMTIMIFPPLAISACVGSLLQAHNRVDLMNYSRFFFEIAKAMALIITSLVFEDIAYVALILLISAYLRAFVDYFILIKKVNYSITEVEFKRIAGVFKRIKFAIPALISVLLTSGVAIADKFVISKYFSKEILAQFNIAFDVNAKAYFIVFSVLAALFPKILHSYAQATSQKTWIKLAKMTILAAIVFYYVPLFIFGKEIVSLWINPQIAEQVYPLIRIFTVASCFYLFGNIYENQLLAMGKVRLILNSYLVAIPVYLVALAYGAVVKQSIELCTLAFLLYMFVYMLMNYRAYQVSQGSTKC